MTTDWMTEAACIGVDPDVFYRQASGRRPADWTDAGARPVPRRRH